MLPAQAMLNRWIRESSAARSQLRTLEGRAMRIDVADTPLRVLLRVVDQQMHLSLVDADVEADIVVSAGAFELLGLLQMESQNALAAGEIEFRGSLRTAEQFSRVLRLARPSLEDELAGWIGGQPARAIAQGGAALFAWGRQAAAAFERDTANYLKFEAREVPLREAVEDFATVTEALRDDLDRLEQRLERLHTVPRR